MSTVGIVCEYNPFHKGHEYQIQQAKLLTGAEHVICFMSGNFLQRGVPAIADKHTRTEIALRCGVDAVFEIPFVYASSSARDYAHAAVCMMNALDGIDYISFGAECDDMDLLQKIAELTVNEPPQVSEFIKKSVSSGISYGSARAAAISEYLQNQNLTELGGVFRHNGSRGLAADAFEVAAITLRVADADGMHVSVGELIAEHIRVVLFREEADRQGG